MSKNGGGPRDYPSTQMKMDVRPGGVWRGCLRSTENGRELWQRGEFREVVKPERIVFTFAREEEGERDLSAKINAMYDDQYLYVGADVTDDSLVTHWDFPRMSYPWDTDCMEVVLDTRMNSTQGYDPPMPGLFHHLSMAEYRETDFSAETWQGAGAGGPLLPKPNLVPGAETYFHRTTDGHIFIARYLLSSMKNIVVRPRNKIGFDIAINDNDGTNY